MCLMDIRCACISSTRIYIYVVNFDVKVSVNLKREYLDLYCRIDVMRQMRIAYDPHSCLCGFVLQINTSGSLHYKVNCFYSSLYCALYIV